MRVCFAVPNDRTDGFAREGSSEFVAAACANFQRWRTGVARVAEIGCASEFRVSSDRTQASPAEGDELGLRCARCEYGGVSAE